ncbi:MAG TPA: sugar phosphate nucleotidyltransferase [Patescibacteria group bacterium]|nr:sugar phosphate nucleotidyltransferase [Patescibacteria group bacterium]
MPKNPHLYIVILAGGGGTRLWPKSREKTPKQFLKLYTQKTLMQDTYERALMFADPDHVLVISNKEYVADVRLQLPDVPPENIVGEPQKRETAAAMFLGALLAYKNDPEAVIVNLASDHVVTDEKEFTHVIAAAVAAATSGEHLVTVGILPQFPHSGLGYIKIDDEIKRIDRLPVFRVTNFTEKPNVATAKAFIATGKYFWNANNYVWRAESLIAAFKKYRQDMYDVMYGLLETINTGRFVQSLEAAYEKVEKISIDYAISEKAENLVLIPGDFGWNDIGDWKVVYDLQAKNETGNVVMCETEGGKVVCHDSFNNLVHTHDRLIALVGMEDTVVVDTGEILLVMPKSRSQDVKKIVEQLKEEKSEFI